MTTKPIRCDQVRDLLPLRTSEDLSLDEAELVDQHVRYCDPCRQQLTGLTRCLEVLHESASARTPVEGRGSLWPRIEPRLGPAGRLRRRPLAWVATWQLAAACIALVAVTVLRENWSQERPLREGRPLAGTGSQRLATVDDPAGERQVLHPMLGTKVQGMNQVLSDRLGLPDQTGALVVDVLPGSSAAVAGIQPADVILAVDGGKILSPEHLVQVISQRQAGEIITLQLFRDGRRIEREVRLGFVRSSLNFEAPWLPLTRRHFAANDRPTEGMSPSALA